MQRLEPRELVAAGLAALAPLAWVLAARAGRAPDVLDGDLGASFVLSLTGLRGGTFGVPASPLGTLLGAGCGLAPLPAARAVVALALWSAGYGGWRFARVFVPERGSVGGLLLALAAQLGPWTVIGLGLGRFSVPALAALSAGPVLLGLAHPALAPLFGWWSPATALVTGVGGLVRRRWVAGLALVALAPLAAASMPGVSSPGGAFAPAPAAHTVPTYAGASEAWFPLPPAESAKWVSASAAYSGRWVHPLSVAVSGFSGDARPTTALPLAVEAAVVPAPTGWVAPSLWAQARLGEGAARAWVRGSGMESALVPFGAALLALAAILLGRRAALLPVLPAAAVSAAVVAALPNGVGPARVRTADLMAIAPDLEGASVSWFPPPEAPYSAGRVSETQAAALLSVAGASVASATTVDLPTLARTTGYGLDTLAAQPLTEGPWPANLGEPATTLVIDVAALPPWTWTELQRTLTAAGATVAGEGTLRVVRFRPE